MSPPPTTLTSPKLVPTFGASAHTGIPVYRLRAMAQQGMPCVHIGRKLYFDLDEVDVWISQNLGTGGDTARPAANAIGADPDWVAEQLAKFTPDDLRRAGQLLLALANGGGAA